VLGNQQQQHTTNVAGAAETAFFTTKVLRVFLLVYVLYLAGLLFYRL